MLYAADRDDLSWGILDFHISVFFFFFLLFPHIFSCIVDSAKMGNPNLDHGSKSAEATAEVVSNPPPYSSITEPIDGPPTYQQQNVSHRLSRDGFPRSEEMLAIDECITHLKFLSAIAKLRYFIERTDKLFGIHDSEAMNFADPRKQSQAAARIQEKRWAVYVARAVDRFAVWWQTCLPSLNTSHISTLNSSSEAKIVWSANMMPPLGKLF